MARKARVGMDEITESRRRAAFAVVAVALMVTAVPEIAVVDLPLINPVTACLLILSGLRSLGTVV